MPQRFKTWHPLTVQSDSSQEARREYCCETLLDWDVQDRRYILEDKGKREEMDFCPGLVWESCAQFCTFPGLLNVNLSQGLHLARKPINMRVLADWRPREMALQGPTLERRHTLKMINWLCCQLKSKSRSFLSSHTSPEATQHPLVTQWVGVSLQCHGNGAIY